MENTDINAAFVREYGSSEAARTVVLYDLPECDVAGFAASLKKAALVAVYFCCIIMLIMIMRLKCCSGAAPTVCIWRKPIKNGLPPEKEVIADEAVLIAECGMEEIYLTVFEELNFINRSGGKVSMAAVRKIIWKILLPSGRLKKPAVGFTGSTVPICLPLRR